MKRHEALQPFSRDHNVGLVIARRLAERPGQDALNELIAIWQDEMADHFAEEERLLIPLATADQASQLVSEHRHLEALIVGAQLQVLTEAEMKRIGELLADHIRWEERVLFPALESMSSIQDIAPETKKLEERRAQSPHSPRRSELIRGRKPTSGA